MAIVNRRNKNGSIRFQVKVKDREGKWYPTRAFTDLADAKTEEGRLFELNRKGTLALSQDAKEISLNDFWDVWSVANRPKVSEGWKISQNQMYRDYVRDVIGARKVGEVDKLAISQVLAQMKDDGLSDQTRRHVYNLLRTMFGDAVEYYEMLSKSPVVAKFHCVKVPKTKRNFHQPATAIRLCLVARGSYLGPPVSLGNLSALRISEIQALRGDCLLFDQNSILVRAAFNRKTGVLQDYPKQENWAYVPMPPMLKEYLLSLKVGPDEWVAPGPNGGMLDYGTYYKGLKRLCREVGVTELTSHELRHSSTEIWMQAGATEEDIRRLLNHASSATTATYIHRTDDRLNAIGQNLGRLHLVEVPSGFPNSFPIGKQTSVCTQDENAAAIR